MRQLLEPEECQPILSEARPEILLGNACCKVDDQGEGETGDYVLDDQNLLFHDPRGKLHVVVVSNTGNRYATREQSSRQRSWVT